MASQWKQGGLVHLMNGGSQALKMGLLKSTYTQDPDHDLVSEINTNECDATNYPGGFGGGGRKTLSSVTVTVDDTNNRAVLDAADTGLTWTSLGGATNNTLRYAFVCWENTADTDSKVIVICDMGADKNTNGGDFTITIDAAGLGYVSV